MANKQVYRAVRGDGDVLVAIFDPYTNKSIPSDPSNADYIVYQAKVDAGLALLLDDGEAVPDGVTDAATSLPAPVTLPAEDGPNVPPSMKPSYLNKG